MKLPCLLGNVAIGGEFWVSFRIAVPSVMAWLLEISVSRFDFVTLHIPIKWLYISSKDVTWIVYTTSQVPLFLCPMLPPGELFVFLSCPSVRSETCSEAFALWKQSQQQRINQRGRGRRWWWRLWFGRWVLGKSPLLWLHQAGLVLRDRDGTLRTATQAPQNSYKELPPGQFEVYHPRGAVSEEGRMI